MRVPPAVRVFRLLSLLLPDAMRRRHGGDMEALFAWQLGRQRSRGERIVFVLRAYVDIVREAAGTRTKRATREPTATVRRRSSVEPYLHDARISIRNLIRQPSVTLPIVLTLGLGIGLATAMVAVVQIVLLRPLPFPEDDRLVVVRERTEQGALLPASYLNFSDWRAGAAGLTGLSAVVGPQNATVLGGATPERLPALFVSADYFAVAGVPAFAGRVLRADENRPGAAPAVVVSHAFWTRVLGANPDLGGVALTIQDLLGRVESYTVVGVMPPGFDLMGSADVYLPLDRAVPWNVRGNHVVHVVGRLAPQVSLDAAQGRLDALQARIHASHEGETEAVGAGVTALRDEVVGPVRTPMLLLLIGALLLLMTAFLNASGAQLARGIARQQELQVRVSLGATRGRLLSQLVMESALYATAGFVIGVAFARGLLQLLARFAPASIPRLDEVDTAWLGLSAAGGALAAAGMLLFGVATAAITVGRGSGALRVRPGQTTRGTRLVWRALIASEVALALMLLSTAGVLGRSLWGIVSADTGFDAAGVVTAEVNLPISRYGGEAFARFFETTLTELRAQSHYNSVGLSNMLPVPGLGSVGGPVRLENGEQPDAAIEYRVADAGFFATLGIELLRGRVFDETDVAGAPHAAVINSSMAERLWPGEDPLGRRFHVGGMDPYRDDWLTVVGVVAEARPWTVEPGRYPVYYVHYLQRPVFLAFTGADFVVRGGGSGSVAEDLRTRIGGLATDVPVRVRSLDERLSGRTADRRFVLSLIAVFAGLALALTAVGIWGVVSFIASRRTRDMSIRLALGARPAQVLRGIQWEAAPPVAIGMIAGGALGSALVRLVRSQLYGVGVFDPLSLGVVAATVAATAWCASYIPARRAKRLDPAVMLREQ